ncbi:hypothetical protein [Nonomuraea ceibae]|uniref:hypothetical protein n=1 Tax=Nonomuraea ceibae TaxID=1935170 RepID=UPI001C5F647C|nr:hypothetical protein [Nonomuraea ceibae]
MNSSDDIATLARVVVMLAVAYVLAALTLLGHVIVLVAGAIDALATSYVGLPRLSCLLHRFAEVVRETAREEGP